MSAPLEAAASGGPRYTREQWDRMHPWPAELGGGKRVGYLWRYEAAASPEELWRVLSDTSRINRALGLPEMHFTEVSGQLHGWSVNGGIRHEWIELPWNWVAGHWFEGARLYSRGLLKAIHVIKRIDAAEGRGSVVHISFDIVPRGALGVVAARLAFPPLQQGYASILRDILPGQEFRLPRSEPQPLSGQGEARLASIVQSLRAQGLTTPLLARVADWVRLGDDDELSRIQVPERARAWGVGEDELLSLFLHATRAGLFDLSWDVVCPHCRGVREGYGKASELTRMGSCEACAIEFETDEAVEITFHVHPSVRLVEKRVYCSAEPAKKIHVRLQQRLTPGASRAVRPQLARGRWRMLMLGEKRYGYLETREGEGSAELTWRSSDAPGERAAAQAPALQLVNDAAAPATFVIETPTWSDSALRPGRLLSFYAFRDLFSEEYLGADVQLSIGEQTILFTDIVGSTALYAQRGDPGAFVEVKRHFDRVFEVIGANRGAVVKTVGDAVMGTFGDPVDAVKASEGIQRAFPEPAPGSQALRLRISLHTGPCIAVRFNAGLDYFGGTVNVAAKLQALAGAGEVAMSLRTWSAAGAADWVAARGGPIVDLVYRSAALPEPVPVKQWTPPGG